MSDVLQDGSAARRAIPDFGYDWPDHRLKTLDIEVHATYPELVGWPPYLAAEGHLYYASRFPCDPFKVEARSLDFLAFLRSTIAGHVERQPTVATNG